jgi:hypothetical protein
MNSAHRWSYHFTKNLIWTHKLLSHASVKVRQQQLEILFNELKPTAQTKVLDVGTTTDEVLPDSNFFEQAYPFPKKLLAVSVEDCRKVFKKRFPNIRFRQIRPNTKLPFKDKQFDLVTSWATIEHVGDLEQQAFFLKELFRVGKKVFVTTPDKMCPYEPHSALWFVHWFPHPFFAKVCRLFGRHFWSEINNLSPLSEKDILSILPSQKKVKVLHYKMFWFLPTHLLIIKK